MSIHCEWAAAQQIQTMIAAPGVQMEDGQYADEGHWTLLLMANEHMLIEGTLDELEALSKSIASRVKGARRIAPDLEKITRRRNP